MLRERCVSLAGQQIGSWTILDDFQYTEKGERKWLCQCACGTKRYVLERSLRYGLSSSCGCVNRAKAKAATEHDLRDQKFGQLKVLHKADKQNRSGGTWWLCQCSCGKLCEYPATLLVTGKRTSCGCASAKNYAFCNIAGQHFGRLTALYALSKRDSKGSIVWHCKCTCGNEVDVSYNCLVYSNLKSCGCQKKEHGQSLGRFLTRVDGTSLDMIKSTKLPTDNTTGVKGVYFIKGKYMAKIVFQKKAYYLGTYQKFEDATAARKEAEELLYVGTQEYYRRWKSRADVDAAWANDNPIRILVTKDPAGGLAVSYSPNL